MTSQQSPHEKNSIEDAKLENAVETLSIVDDSGLPPPPKLTAEEERKLYRKIDWWLMPILTLMYLASFLDRGQSHNSSSTWVMLA
jgi:hypothetical protein